MRKWSVSTTAETSVGAPACRRPHASEELVHAERLGDEIVGAGVERGDLVPLGAAGGEDDDRHTRPLAQPAHDVEAIHPRESEIEDDDVGVVDGGQFEGLLTGAGEQHVVAAGREVGVQRPLDGRLVVDDQHGGHR